ncbi:MAG TPA: tetratricopeptide repeat protein [Desulfatiglandales bacterium]|nr:tetratricopeptide repeat protein [Desulfatiglandales bacterium]
MNKSNLCKILAFSAVVILISGMSLQVLAQTEKGIELYNSWEFNKAEEAFREVLKNRPDDAQAGYYLGLSLLMQEKYQEALDSFQKAKAHVDKAALSKKAGTPDKGQLEIALTRAYLGLKKYPEVWECLEAAEKANANPADIHTFRGAYYLERNNTENAVKELEKAIELDSLNAYAYYYAGYAYLRLGHPARAVDMFEMFLRLAPYAPEAGKAKFLVDSLC